jgi:acyl dehydratase
MAGGYLEDFAAGQRFGGATRIRIEKERIKTFAAEFDPQPFHRLAYRCGNDAAAGGK